MNHSWNNLGSVQGVTLPNEKYTKYECAYCNEIFLHYYDIEPSIYKAMEMSGISDVCHPQSKNTNVNTASTNYYSSKKTM